MSLPDLRYSGRWEMAQGFLGRWCVSVYVRSMCLCRNTCCWVGGRLDMFVRVHMLRAAPCGCRCGHTTQPEVNYPKSLSRDRPETFPALCDCASLIAEISEPCALTTPNNKPRRPSPGKRGCLIPMTAS